MEVKRKFGLFTAICMIIGIVVGSGIFFKSDDVLVYTNGSIFLGVIVFAFAALAIIFGSLSMAELEIRTTKTGGIVAYAEENLGNRIASVFGWYQSFVYFPATTAVVSWVVGIYGCILFGIDASLELQIAIGIFAVVFFHIINYFSAKLSGLFQNAATVIKLIPIFIVTIVGLLFSNPDFTLLTNSVNFQGGTTWIAAIGPIAFAYEGWTVATSLSHEIKDAKRNLPLALIISPIIILTAYILYFVGISLLVGPEQIMVLGDAHVDVAVNAIFGSAGSKILLTFIVISVLGTTNGLILGISRGIYALGIKKMIPHATTLSAVDEQYNTPTNALKMSLVVVLFWMLIHYVTTKLGLLGNSDVSEIAIFTSYLFYILLYAQVIKLAMRGEIKSRIKGYLIPVLAIIGSLIVFFGAMQSSMFWIYTGINFVIILVFFLYARKYVAK